MPIALQPSTQSWRVIWVRCGRLRKVWSGIDKRPGDEAVDHQSPIGELLGEHAVHIRAFPASRVPFERKIGDRSDCAYSRASASRGEISRWLAMVSFSAERSTPAEPWAVVQAVAAAEQQARGAGSDEAAAVHHGSPLSRGTRKRPVIIDPISLIGPASSTIIRCTRMKPSSSAAQMKWIDRAD